MNAGVGLPGSAATPTPQSSLHQQAFWLYGVIAGLAVKEALSGYLPALFSTDFSLLGMRAILPHTFRVGLFLLLLIRFYIGAGAFSDRAHGGDTTTPGYGIDFLFGILHFLLFYALASACAFHTAPLLFPILIIAVLAYDLLWLIFRKTGSTPAQKDAGRQLKLWTFLNIASLIVGALAYILTFLLSSSYHWAELVAFIPVTLVSLADLVEMLGRRYIVTAWMQRHFLPQPNSAGPAG